MKKQAVTILGVSLITVAAGCCCGNQCGPCGPGYGAAYYGNSCPGGNCGIPGAGTNVLPPQGAFYQGYGSTQAGAPVTIPGPVTALPPTQQFPNQQVSYQQVSYPQVSYPQTGYPQTGYPQTTYQQAAFPQTAMGPLESLPTY
jgi:hypothetical protein